MAPLPKKKHAKSRTRTRRAAISFSVPNLVTCPKCGSLKLPHMACPNCGFYKQSLRSSPASPDAGLR